MRKMAAPVDLSPHFLAANHIVALQEGEGVVVVTASRPLSDAALAALQFAAGLPVRVQIAEPERTFVRHGFEKPDSNGDHEYSGSLATSLFARFARHETQTSSLAGFAECLEAGYSPVQAADLMLACGAGASADADLRSFYHDLCASKDFAAEIARSTVVPRWMGQAIAFFPGREMQVRLFARLIPIIAASRSKARQDRFRTLISATVWILAASAWALFWILAGLAMAAGGIAFALWQREGRADARVQAAVLQIIEAAHQMNLPPAVSVRISGQYLLEMQLLTGRIPKTRESLGAALHLSPLRQALFAKGDLGEAAERLIKITERDRKSADSRARRIVCCIGISGFVPLLIIAALQ
ncbi:hypothetical protein G7A66_05050 [Altererythrobacter sp. SALINAS58]|uniref:GspE/PulE/PilB domain-containing protein n=1 Tax=Alteripontixanthobacter muriae TaxID=2705546 RepID=UPI001576DE43|nr:hypothetical protein [Alteripontixanthobacter muriae]NTZ42463.1 hypothetical protein [Alteripontixanthobacter muriae]